MGMVVLRSEDYCLRSPVPADAFRPPPPPRPVRHRTGCRPRQTMIPAGTVASPGSWAAPSPTKPLPYSGCGGPIRPRRRRRTPEHRRRMAVRRPVKELVTDEVIQVAVLERLQQAAAAAVEEEEDRRPVVVPEWNARDLELCSTGRLGPDPANLPRRTRLTDQMRPYTNSTAGSSGSFTSPPPSSLPLPTTSFLAKKDSADAADLATAALRSLLRLDHLP